MKEKTEKARTIPAEDSRYEFKGGYPTDETVQRAYDEADLNRSIQTYRFFYPSVSIRRHGRAI